MSPDINVYVVDLPPKIKEMVCPSGCGYTIYIDAHQNIETQRQSFLHAMSHIYGDDWNKDDVQEIELSAHKKGTPQLTQRLLPREGTIRTSACKPE